ncbi:MAG: KH domain-containing protein [Microcystaceae cyanobacterium]
MVSSPSNLAASPHYTELLSFLLKPFLAPTDSVVVHSEQVNPQTRIWLRVAVNSEDKGRVFGRGGRNLQSIRTVLETAAAVRGQHIFLDVFDMEVEPLAGSSGYPPRRRRTYGESTGDTDRLQRRRSRPVYAADSRYTPS